MIKIALINILFSLLIFDSPMNPQDIYTLNDQFNNIPQYPINNSDAILYFTYKQSGNSVPNSLAEGRAEKRAEELNGEFNKGKYFHLTFTAQLNCSGYNFDNDTFERVVWKNIEKISKKNVYEIKPDDYKTKKANYVDSDITCNTLFLNMAGIIGMYNQLLFPTYVSEKIKEEYLKQDWINFSVEILFNTFETAYPSETPDQGRVNPGCALIVPYAIRIQNGDAMGIYIFE